MKVRDALKDFYRENNIPEDGGMNDNSFIFKVFGLTLKLPNPEIRRKNIYIHDIVSGTPATQRKEILREAVMDVMDLGDEELDKEDKYLLEINLGDLDTTSGECQSYWLLAVEAAVESR